MMPLIHVALRKLMLRAEQDHRKPFNYACLFDINVVTICLSSRDTKNALRLNNCRLTMCFLTGFCDNSFLLTLLSSW